MSSFYLYIIQRILLACSNEDEKNTKLKGQRISLLYVLCQLLFCCTTSPYFPYFLLQQIVT